MLKIHTVLTTGPFAFLTASLGKKKFISYNSPPLLFLSIHLLMLAVFFYLRWHNAWWVFLFPSCFSYLFSGTALNEPSFFYLSFRQSTCWFDVWNEWQGMPTPSLQAWADVCIDACSPFKRGDPCKAVTVILITSSSSGSGSSSDKDLGGNPMQPLPFQLPSGLASPIRDLLANLLSPSMPHRNHCYWHFFVRI